MLNYDSAIKKMSESEVLETEVKRYSLWSFVCP